MFNFFRKNKLPEIYNKIKKEIIKNLQINSDSKIDTNFSQTETSSGNLKKKRNKAANSKNKDSKNSKNEDSKKSKNKNNCTSNTHKKSNNVKKISRR